MDALRALGERAFLGNPVSTWAHALLIFAALLTVLPFVRLTAPKETPLLRQQFMLRLVEQLRAMNLSFGTAGAIISASKPQAAPPSQGA